MTNLPRCAVCFVSGQHAVSSGGFDAKPLNGVSIMGLFEIIFIAIGLAMDAFAVSLGVGTTGHARGYRASIRMSFHFGLFQALMPIIGWFAGKTIAPFIAVLDHWVAFALLVFVGGRMIRSGLSPEAELHESDPTRGFMLVLLSVATSIDALAVGLSLAMLGVTIWYPVVVIGVVTASLSLLGCRVGSRLGLQFGKTMEIIGGGVLILIGIRVVISHLFS
jgi:putative Mn2+ efflux pump MntP